MTQATTTRAALSLLALWGASWALSYADLGAWSLPVALAIAVAKAAIVVLVFMEILLEGTSVHATVLTGIGMIAILVFFMVADVRTRTVPLLPPGSQNCASALTP
jgi:cytochrome c oxidase subunit 4